MPRKAEISRRVRRRLCGSPIHKPTGNWQKTSAADDSDAACRLVAWGGNFKFMSRREGVKRSSRCGHTVMQAAPRVSPTASEQGADLIHFKISDPSSGAVIAHPMTPMVLFHSGARRDAYRKINGKRRGPGTATGKMRILPGFRRLKPMAPLENSMVPEIWVGISTGMVSPDLGP